MDKVMGKMVDNMELSLDEGVVPDLLVPGDVVDDAINVAVLLGVVLGGGGEQGLHNLGSADLILGAALHLAGLGFLVADDGGAGLLVVADEGQAPGEGGDGVALDVVPLRGGDAVEPGGPVAVAHSGGAESDHLDILKDARLGNVDVAEAGQGTAQTDAGDDEPAGVNGLPEPVEDIGPDGVPHLVELALDLGALGCTLVLGLALSQIYLESPEDVLEHVLDGGGVSESQDRVLFIDCKGGLDVLGLLFDDVGVQGLVGGLAAHAPPGVGVLIAAHFQGVDQGQLCLPGDGGSGGDKGGHQDNVSPLHLEYKYIEQMDKFDLQAGPAPEPAAV